MNTSSSKLPLILAGLALLLASLACRSLFPKVVQPGSLEEQVAEGNMRFHGTGNLTYIGCQDPSAAVSLTIGPKTKEIEGTQFNDYVNPVSVHAITDGSLVKMEECQKVGQGDSYDWPAEGIYYPQENRILFTTCTQNKEKAEGEGFLVGEGFEGEYACWDRDGGLMYEIAFSAYEISK